jgi:uncharacterized membrane protein YfcA
MMAGVTLEILVYLWVGAFFGAFAVGGAGFAFALAASAVWLHVLDPIHTTILAVASGVVLHGGSVWSMRKSIEPRRLSPFLIGGLLGIPVGLYVLTRTDPQAIKLALGLFLAGYGLYVLLTPRLPIITAGGRVADAGIGFVGGVLGGIGGYSGVLPTIWAQLRGWPKEVGRAVYQPFILVAQIATLILVGVVALDAFGLVLMIASLPALLAGAWLGWHVYGRLDERRFRQMLAALLVASGATLLL